MPASAAIDAHRRPVTLAGDWDGPSAIIQCHESRHIREIPDVHVWRLAATHLGRCNRVCVDPARDAAQQLLRRHRHCVGRDWLDDEGDCAARTAARPGSARQMERAGPRSDLPVELLILLTEYPERSAF